MKKICKVMLSIFLCFTIIGVSGISNSYASSHIPSIDEKGGGNLVSYIIKKRATFINNTVDCYFRFDSDDITGEVYNLTMYDYFVHEHVPGSCKVDLYSTKKTDKYTFEATVRYRQYGPFGGLKDTEYKKLYIYR